MPDTTNTKSDLEILTQLNADFLASAQNGDVRRYEQILAEDFYPIPWQHFTSSYALHRFALRAIKAPMSAQ